MPEPPSTFRDFGIIPDDLPPPSETVRSYLSGLHVFGQYLATFLAVGVGLVVAGWLGYAMPWWLKPLACAATLAGFGAFVFLVTRNDYRWIELRGDALRAKHLYTGRLLERGIGDIESLNTLVNPARGLEVIITEKLLGRVRGIDIHLRNERTRLRVMRSDPAMTNARELIEAVVYRMQQIGPLDYEIVNVAGRPLLRKIFWKDHPPEVQRGNNGNVIMACFGMLALLFGSIIGLQGVQERELRSQAATPAQEITLAALIANGPGANRHVIVTEFVPRGYVFDGQPDDWSSVSVALFPADVAPAAGNEIRAVLDSNTIRGATELRSLLQEGRINGICSADRSAHWGAAFGPKMAQANPGCRLAASWWIEDASHPPSEAKVTGRLTGAAVLFAVVLVLGYVVYRRNV